jgi:hypothetical protein
MTTDARGPRRDLLLNATILMDGTFALAHGEIRERLQWHPTGRGGESQALRYVRFGSN